MRLIIPALCSLIFWNCYTVPYKAPDRTFYPQAVFTPEEEEPDYSLALYESAYIELIGGHLTYTDILNESDSSNIIIVLRIDNRTKTSVINIKPKLNTEQFIGDYNDYKAYIIFNETDFTNNRITFRLKFGMKEYRR